VVLLMTVSRGAFVGLFVGGLWGMWLCRRDIPLQRFVMFGFVAMIGVVLAVVVAGLIDPAIGGTIVDRLTGQSTSIDAGEMSSGRTAIWAGALKRMLQTPGTFLWGFGWDVYSTMPFRYAPHNIYLSLWFELGLPGVLTFIFIQGRTTLAAFRAIEYAKEPEIRAQLIAFVFGFLMLAVAMFFADLITPWPYIWMYVGVILKMIVLMQEETVDEFQPLRVAQVPSRPAAARPFNGALPRPVR
jgi:O-antigen ligase